MGQKQIPTPFSEYSLILLPTVKIFTNKLLANSLHREYCKAVEERQLNKNIHMKVISNSKIGTKTSIIHCNYPNFSYFAKNLA